jgi:hypothetical protein
VIEITAIKKKERERQREKERDRKGERGIESKVSHIEKKTRERENKMF